MFWLHMFCCPVLSVLFCLTSCYPSSWFVVVRCCVLASVVFMFCLVFCLLLLLLLLLLCLHVFLLSHDVLASYVLLSCFILLHVTPLRDLLWCCVVLVWFVFICCLVLCLLLLLGLHVFLLSMMSWLHMFCCPVLSYFMLPLFMLCCGVVLRWFVLFSCVVLSCFVLCMFFLFVLPLRCVLSCLVVLLAPPGSWCFMFCLPSFALLYCIVSSCFCLTSCCPYSCIVMLFFFWFKSYAFMLPLRFMLSTVCVIVWCCFVITTYSLSPFVVCLRTAVGALPLHCHLCPSHPANRSPESTQDHPPTLQAHPHSKLTHA